MTSPVEKIDLDAIRERAEKAMPGPWQVKDRPRTGMEEHAYLVDPVAFMFGGTDYKKSEATADFIAHARTDIPALLSLINRLTEERDGMREALKPFAAIASHGVFGGPMTCAKAIYEDSTDEDSKRCRTRLDPVHFERARAALRPAQETEK